MTDEKDPKDPASDPNKKDEGGNGEPKDPETIDYKAELEKAKQEQEALKKQLGQAEHTILKLKHKKDEEPEEPEENPEEAEETARKIAREEAAKLLIAQTKSQAHQLAQSLASNDDERDLIMFHYENTVKPTGNLEQDIKRAKLMANERRIDKDFEQLRRTAQSKENKGIAGGEGGQLQPIEEGEPKLDDKSKNMLEKAGLTWDGKRKGYVGRSGRFHSLAEVKATIGTPSEK